MNVEGLHQLAGSLRGRNAIDAEIARLIDRPALPGHLGEWIASQIFDIELANSAVTKGIDGALRQAPQPGATVNVKLYGTRSGFVDLIEEASADYYLVLTGPIAQAASSRGMHRPVCIRGVYLFETRELISDLRARGNRIGVASSVRKPLWEAAELYPNPTNPALVLSDAQRYALALFRDPSDEHQLSNRPAQSRPRTLPRRLVTPSRSSIGERRRTGVEAFRVALESRGFAVDEPTPGRSIVFCAHRRGRMIEVHFRSSTGVGPAYWPKSTLEPAPHRYGGLALFQADLPPELFLIPSLEWRRPNGVLVDRTYEQAASQPEWGVNLPGALAALDLYALDRTLAES